MPDISNELILKAAGGDMAAFEAIYKASSGFVYTIALRVTNNRDDADEVTQDVFVKIFNGLKEFGFRSSFKTWIYRIAANTAINHAKSAFRHRRSKVEYDPAIHDAEAPAAADASPDTEEAKAQVARLLDALDPDQRAVLVLREIEELDYRAIADTLKININTVRSRLKRAREKMIARARKG